ncbi:16S rRNA (cytosine967-C5)-methyltransferase [Microlunatus sagamiharensis]|uniref:16S rRNA (Cytosine967-C5)-methyltransferase n=1 Tax=Microlunatus sagamiharensis TaxID=546874 RepID=A0A1H2M688_9ACTN|nr:transcription antitermination factor NusB [Microlunatus sagamiharensis]SDU88689.1 16S rRNA (cytosine967-C5)-methyltransferase [Microlunatus sagamiharensis]
MPARVDRARRVAFDALRRVTGEEAYANLVLPGLLTERGITGRDAAFATELLNGTCRWLGTYDAVLAAAAGRPLSSLQPAVVDLLRLGTHQLLGMRVGSHAAVSATVDLAAATVGRRVTGLVNAVLRKVAARDLDDWVTALATGDGHDRLGLAHAHPRWVVDAYADLLPDDELVAALEADNVSPRVSLVVRPGLADVDELLDELDGTGERSRLSPFGVRTSGNPGDVPLVRTGRAGVQDEGSQLVAWGVTRPEAGRGPWLDLSAGPGGKTALLAGLAAADGSRVLAGELAPHRAGLVVSGARAYPLERRPQVVVADATRPAWRPGTFTRVLADVPCTGVGALRRRPEARWRRDPADVEALHPLQRALLTTALDAAAPGGVVAYVTCSPHRRETVDVVEETLAGRDDVEVLPVGTVLPGILDATTGPEGEFLQLWPHRHGTDAMFAAYLRRR